MIAYVDTAPDIHLHGEHFLLSVASGDDRLEFLLTTKAFYVLKARCCEAGAKRTLADLAAREKVVAFPKSTKPKRGKR